MSWVLLEKYPNKDFDLWRNVSAGYNETFRKGVNPNIHRKKTLLEIEMDEEMNDEYCKGE